LWRGLRALRFLKPCPRRLLLFAFYASLSIAGVIQSYAFIDDVPGLERPPLYDQLRGFDFWFPLDIVHPPHTSTTPPRLETRQPFPKPWSREDASWKHPIRLCGGLMAHLHLG